jgi:hypothetical protein
VYLGLLYEVDNWGEDEKTILAKAAVAPAISIINPIIPAIMAKGIRNIVKNKNPAKNIKNNPATKMPNPNKKNPNMSPH